MSLTNQTILVTLAARDVLATFAAPPPAVPNDKLSIIHPISKIIEAVESTSSQKKNELKYPLRT